MASTPSSGDPLTTRGIAQYYNDYYAQVGNSSLGAAGLQAYTYQITTSFTTIANESELLNKQSKEDMERRYGEC